jgi:heterodisulfide reductase subunit A-like polyferredoxin
MAKKIKLVLCNCKGLCPSFKDINMNTLPFEAESELDIEYAALSPQSCGAGGNKVLRDVMESADEETYALSGACAPEAQKKLFKRVLRESGFNEKHFVAVDIRETDNAGVLKRLKDTIDFVEEKGVCPCQFAAGSCPEENRPSELKGRSAFEQ